MIKSFKQFIVEVDDNPNPKSGSLEANITKDNKSAGLQTDPSKKAALLAVAKGMLAGGKSHVDILKRLMSAGSKGSDIVDYTGEVERRVNDPSHTNYTDSHIKDIAKQIRDKRNDK